MHETSRAGANSSPHTTPTIVTLVGCAKEKQPVGWVGPARELYTSRQFSASMSLAAEFGHPIRILSALHGVLELDRVVEPYDATAINKEWGPRVLAQLEPFGARRFIILA